MTSDIEHLQVVLEAAQRLLAAREDDMITGDEWEALANAVDQCNAADTPRADEDGQTTEHPTTPL